jgi:hypothetical protein
MDDFLNPSYWQAALDEKFKTIAIWEKRYPTYGERINLYAPYFEEVYLQAELIHWCLQVLHGGQVFAALLLARKYEEARGKLERVDFPEIGNIRALIKHFSKE